jgi:hypothetical protein
MVFLKPGEVISIVKLGFIKALNVQYSQRVKNYNIVFVDILLIRLYGPRN